VFAFGLSPTDAWWRMSGAKMRHPWRIYASVYREHKANSVALRPWRPPPDPIWHPPGLHEFFAVVFGHGTQSHEYGYCFYSFCTAVYTRNTIKPGIDD
jgi:hypothetical protein